MAEEKRDARSTGAQVGAVGMVAGLFTVAIFTATELFEVAISAAFAGSIVALGVTVGVAVGSSARDWRHDKESKDPTYVAGMAIRLLAFFIVFAVIGCATASDGDRRVIALGPDSVAQACPPDVDPTNSGDDPAPGCLHAQGSSLLDPLARLAEAVFRGVAAGFSAASAP